MQLMKKVKLVVCDDHPLISEGLQTFAEKRNEIQFLGSFSNQKDLNAFLENNVADILILDIHLPDNCGTEVCKDLTKRYPDMKIIGLSNSDDPNIIMKMIKNGASGYLLKSAPIKELELAIQLVSDGDIYLGSEAQRAVSLFHVKNQAEIPPTTSREREVLSLLAKGFSSVEVAEKLFISPQTVDSHRKSLLQKFKVNKTVNLISKAKELGIL